MYTILIDESGDVGLKNVRADPSEGPSQYFAMCAAIFREENRLDIEDAWRSLPWNLGKLRHAKHLTHFEKVYACKIAADLPVGLLGVISNKLTLGSYLPDAQKTPTHYYNKVCQYLFERIGLTLTKLNVSATNTRIRLEAREQQYSSLMTYIQRIQETPLDHRATAIRSIDRFSITAIKKKDDYCMWLPDLGANALFSTVRKSQKSFAVTETRYVRELAPRWMAKTNGHVLGGGIKAIHKLNDLSCDEDVARVLAQLTNPHRDFHRL